MATSYRKETSFSVQSSCDFYDYCKSHGHIITVFDKQGNNVTHLFKEDYFTGNYTSKNEKIFKFRWLREIPSGYSVKTEDYGYGAITIVIYTIY